MIPDHTSDDRTSTIHLSPYTSGGHHTRPAFSYAWQHCNIFSLLSLYQLSLIQLFQLILLIFNQFVAAGSAALRKPSNLHSSRHLQQKERDNSRLCPLILSLFLLSAGDAGRTERRDSFAGSSERGLCLATVIIEWSGEIRTKTAASIRLNLSTVERWM